MFYVRVFWCLRFHTLWRLYMHFRLRLWSSMPYMQGGSMVNPIELQISILSKTHRYFRWKWKEMFKQDKYLRRVGKWEGLCPSCDCLSSAEKVTKTWIWTNTPKPIMDVSNSTSCYLCHQYVSKNVWKVGIANAKLGQGLLGAVRTLLSFVVSWLSETTHGWSFVRDKQLWDCTRFRRCRHRLGFQM